MAQIVLMRHGHALSTHEAGVSYDSERPLSGLGETEVLQAVLHLKASGFVPDYIISSPFKRADRTATIAAGTFPGAERKTAAALSNGPLQEVLSLVQGGFPEEARILIVGHQPLLGAAAGALLGADIFDLSPAGFVRLDFLKTKQSGSLAEYYTPPKPGGQDR